MPAALWLAAGTALGVLAGVLIADRTRAGRALLRAVGARADARGRRPHARDARADDDDEFVLYDDAGGYEDDGGAGDSPGTRSDRPTGALDERVLAAFEQDPILAVRPIEIDAPDEGTIVLTGRVSTPKDATHAMTIARGVPGVERVDNRLRVGRTPPSASGAVPPR